MLSEMAAPDPDPSGLLQPDQEPDPDQISRAGPPNRARAKFNIYAHGRESRPRPRGRRYSLGTPRGLRVRERGIFLDVRGIFPFPPEVREKVGGPKNSGAENWGRGCEQIMNFEKVAHCVPIFVIDW